MKQLQISLLIILSTFVATAQCKTTATKGKENPSLCQLLKGKWQAEDDANVVLNFKGGTYTETYGEDITDKSTYVLSYSCKLKDSTRANIYNLNKKVYLLLYKNDEVQQCSELLNLTNSVLSRMNNDNGKIFVYKRVKKEVAKQ